MRKKIFASSLMALGLILMSTNVADTELKNAAAFHFKKMIL